jgi:AraC-like DNA-binding protein
LGARILFLGCPCPPFLPAERRNRRKEPGPIHDIAPAAAAPPPGPEAGGAIEISRYSTAHVPPAQRHADWLARTWPRVDTIYRTEPSEPFGALFESVELGEVGFVYVEITGMRWERRLQDIRASDFDPIIVNMMVEGLAQGDCDGRAFREEAGNFHFHDLAKPSIHVSTASRTYSLIVPRPLAARLFGTLDDLHGLVVRGACAELLLAHAGQVWRALPALDRAAAPALGRSLLDLLAAAAAQARVATPPARASDPRLRRRAEAAIDLQLNKPVSVAGLCRELKVSRKSLFAAFREDGGVHTYIRAQRLERVREALADLERAEPIGMIAVRLGFCDAAHLTRLFRARYGMAPRDYRRLVAGDMAPPPEAPAGGA